MQYINNIRQYGLLIVFGIICLIISLITPQFLTLSNLTIIVTQVSINALLAFGVTFVIITGGIDLSLGSIVAVTGVTSAMLAHPDSYPVLIPIVMGLLAGLLMGAFNGFIITKSKIAPFMPLAVMNKLQELRELILIG